MSLDLFITYIYDVTSSNKFKPFYTNPQNAFLYVCKIPPQESAFFFVWV